MSRDPDTFVEKASQFAGEFAGGFFTPLQQLNDIFAQYDESQREIKETRSGDPVRDLLAPSLARIPGLAPGLPAAEIPTREAPLERPAPALKQLGISLRAAKNPAEAELDRLGFTRQEIVPSTGNTRANNLIAKHMGPLVENFLGRVVQNERYRQMTEAQKGAYVQNILRRLRGLARRRAIAENPRLFRKLKRTSRRQQRARDELKET